MSHEGELLFDVAYPQRLSRGLIFVKWLLVFPHLVVLWALGILSSVISFIAFFAILVTGRYPRGLWYRTCWIMRWAARVNVYTGLMRDEYPPFGDQPYPVRFEMIYPERLSRWKIFVKWLLVIPHLVVLWLLSIVSGVATIVAWFAILLTARYPRGLFDFNVGVLRWSARVSIYVLLLSDVYPPFTLDAANGPPAVGGLGVAPSGS